jgi:DNA end-binding protein Ku
MKDLAAHIVETKTKSFDPSAFVDHYEDALIALLKNKQAGLPTAAVGEDTPPPRVINLMDALRASIETSGKKPAAASTPARRTGKKKASTR